MSAATAARPVLPHKEIAAALNVLAVMFENGEMPASEFPDQAPTFHWAVATDTAVRELAARLGVEVCEYTAEDGCTHTSFDYGIGRGVGGYDPAYINALVLRVVHISDGAA